MKFKNPLLSFLKQSSIKRIKKRILQLHKEIYFLNKKSEKSFDNQNLSKKIKNKLIKKEKLEQKLIDLVNQKKVYLGVGVNLKNTLEIDLLMQDWKDISNHSLILGTTRMGKTKFMLSLVKQQIQKGENLIIIDPKNGQDFEVLNKTIEFLNTNNRIQDLFYINPFNKMTEYFNPLFGLSDDEIASMISTILYPGEDSDSKFYSAFIDSTLKAVLYSFTYLEENTDPKKELKNEIIKEEYKKYLEITKRWKNENKDDIIDFYFKDQNFSSERTQIFNRSFITFFDLFSYIDSKKIEYLSQTILDLKPSNHHSIEKQKELSNLRDKILEHVKKTISYSADFTSRVTASLSAFLSGLSNGELGKMLCTVKINPLRYRMKDNDNGLVVLVHPMPLKAKKNSEYLLKVLMKVFENVFSEVSLYGKLINKRRTYCHVDEGESAVYPGVEALANKGAGLGFTMFIYTQSQSDLNYKLANKELSKVLRDNLNSYFVFKLNDLESKEDLVKTFGQKTIVDMSTMVRGGDEFMTSFGKKKESFINSDSIDTLKPGQCFFSNLHGKFLLTTPIVGDVNKENGFVYEDLTEQEIETQRIINLGK